MVPDVQASTAASAPPVRAAGRAYVGQPCSTPDGRRQGEIAALLHLNDQGYARAVVVAWRDGAATTELLASIRRHP